MRATYTNCYNLTGNAYFYSNNISNISNCFSGRYNTTALNIYVHNNTTSLNTLLINNTSSLVGQSITWTDDIAANGCHYNTAFNIYIYPVENVENTRLENEYDTTLEVLNENEYIDINDNSATTKTNWIYAAAPLTIDSGYACAVNVNMSDLENITIEKTGGKQYEL
jgi:hypothetical protein